MDAAPSGLLRSGGLVDVKKLVRKEGFDLTRYLLQALVAAAVGCLVATYIWFGLF
jgi:hypothetical protein